MLVIFRVAAKTCKGKSKAVPLKAWSVPECSRKLRFPVFMTTVQDGGKVVSLTNRSSLPPVNATCTHLLLEDSLPPRYLRADMFWTCFGRHLHPSVCLSRWTPSSPPCLSVPAAVQPTPQHTLSCLRIDWSKLQLNFCGTESWEMYWWGEDWTELCVANGSVSSHTHKHTQTQTHSDTHIQTHTHIWIHTHKHTLRHKSTITRTRNHTLTHTHIPRPARARTHTHKHTLTRTQHTLTHTTHTHTHNTLTTHTHTNTHSQTQPHTHTTQHIHTQTHTHTQQTLTLTHTTHVHTQHTHTTHTHTHTQTHTTHTHSDRSTSANGTSNTCTPTPIATAAHAAPHQQFISAVTFCICVRLSARLNMC